MSSELLTRGVAKIIPEDLAQMKLDSGKKLRLYWGIDPTGGRIHLGHAIPMRKLQAFADAGHDVTLLIGSFTAMIGDPTDRDSLREPLTKQQVEENFKTYKEQASKIIDFSKVKIVYNHEWLEVLGFEQIIELSSHFTVQQMSERAMFAERMAKNKPIGLHEFLYPLMVGYDSVILDVDCEIGGSDQEFNMLAGRTLQKGLGKREKFVLTTPLLEGTDGRKMSKSYNNCVYLDDTPNDMFGQLMSIHDDLMPAYFNCCTDISSEEIETILSGNPRDAKIRLAKEIVTMYHSQGDAEKAAKNFESVFTNKELPDDMPEAQSEEKETVVAILIRTKLVPSTSEARRLIQQGGIKVNDKAITSADTPAQEGVVRVGKRKFLRIVIKKK